MPRSIYSFACYEHNWRYNYNDCCYVCRRCGTSQANHNRLKTTDRCDHNLVSDFGSGRKKCTKCGAIM